MTQPFDGEFAATEQNTLTFEGEELGRFVEFVGRMYNRAETDRDTFAEKCDKWEGIYNLAPYAPAELPFAESLSIRLPTIRTRIDNVASELAATFDQDGAAVFKCMPLSDGTSEIAKKLESGIHEILSEADAMKTYRDAIKRSLKVGVGYVAVEAISSPVNDESGEFENSLRIRAVKAQDMLVYPMQVSRLKQAAFVAERQTIPMWEFRRMVEAGYYTAEFDGNGGFSGFSGLITDPSNEVDTSRIGINHTSINTGTDGDLIMLISAWVRYTPTGALSGSLYHCVFPEGDPSNMLRVIENPYTYLDEPPYTAWAADEGDGVYIGQSYAQTLSGIATTIDNIYMLRLEDLKRQLSQVWTVRRNSPTANLLANKRSEHFDPENPQPNLSPAASGTTRIMPDEVFEVNDHDELQGRPLAQPKGNLSYPEEARLNAMLDEATLPSAPLSGIRSAFEVRQATDKAAAKLKQLIKVLSSTGFIPHIKQVQAIAYEYIFQDIIGTEGYKSFMVGGMECPVDSSSFFFGVRFVPSGATTSADKMLQMQSTADAMNTLVPLAMQIPNLTKDPVGFVRQLMKLRIEALSLDPYMQEMGLEEPTPEEAARQIAYMQLKLKLNGGSEQLQPSQGATGGLDRMADPENAALSVDQNGGAVTGVQRATEQPPSV